MLDELIDRFGKGAVVIARPRMLESGETYRWEVEIDAEPVPDLSIHVRSDAKRPHLRVMWLIYGDEEIELAHWSTRSGPFSQYGPAAVQRTLGDLKRERDSR